MSDWVEIGPVSEVPVSGARVILQGEQRIAVFRNSQDEIFALRDRCPHKGGFLSQGIVHHKTVTCPLHNWKIGLENGEAIAPDSGCTRHFKVKLEDKLIFIDIDK